MDVEPIQIPGLGNITRGKLLTLKTGTDEYTGFIQTFSEGFITLWTKTYIHMIKFEDITYIGLEYNGVDENEENKEETASLVLILIRVRQEFTSYTHFLIHTLTRF